MLKDNFTVTFKLKGHNYFNRKKSVLLEFWEASIGETLEFIEKIERADFRSIEYLYNFFEKSSKGKINKKIFSKYIANNLEQILDILKKTYVKGVFSIENEEKAREKQEIPEKMDVEEFERDLGRLLAFLSEKMSIDPNGILKTYTWRQLNFWTKHYLYLERQKTAEGQKQNKKEENKEHVKKHKTEIDQTLGQLEKYLQKKA